MATFEELENSSYRRTSESSILGDWYQSVRSVAISAMTNGDLARSLRQKIFLHVIVPEVLKRLKNDPLAGDQFDGELVASLNSVAPSDWRALGSVKAEALISLRDVALALEVQEADTSVLVDLSKVFDALNMK